MWVMSAQPRGAGLWWWKVGEACRGWRDAYRSTGRDRAGSTPYSLSPPHCTPPVLHPRASRGRDRLEGGRPSGYGQCMNVCGAIDSKQSDQNPSRQLRNALHGRRLTPCVVGATLCGPASLLVRQVSGPLIRSTRGRAGRTASNGFNQDASGLLL